MPCLRKNRAYLYSGLNQDIHTDIKEQIQNNIEK